MGAAFASTATAAIPSGYYDSCEGKTGQALLEALCDKIYRHTNVGYDGLWNVYKKSDVRPDGTLWDMYSTKAWSTNFTKCGNYKVVGDCVNREHSLPKSWWGGGKSEQYSDAFHLYPTDGKVNGQRSNYPFGECANGSHLAANGSVKPLGKLGNSTFSGFSGTVFEPDDQYKGDFARTYFYMAACYNDRISSWTSGNGYQMLAGNRYPVFKTWAINLLLKWTRQDQVSQKELDRNDAVYGFQHNRNPFIDHPEMAEHIWGDKVGEPWYSHAKDTPDIIQPVQNVTIDLGYAAAGRTRSVSVPVRTKAMEDNVNIAVYGSGFSVSPTTLTASQANNGYNVTVSLNSSKAGTAGGTLSISAGDLEREVDMTATVVDGLPVYDATGVTSNEFTVRWVYLNDATNYTLEVKQNGQSIPGYPRQVTAAAESYTVTDVEPLTTYTYTLSSGTLVSETKSVTTADIIPSITVLFDGELSFECTPGEPSEVAELLLDIENVSDDIKISVDSPFEVSTDKSAWDTTVTLAPEEDRFYLRVNSDSEGKFETAITITAGSYTNDDAEASANVSASAVTDFLEDWESVTDPTGSVPCYSNTTFTGTACCWTVDNGGFGTDSKDKGFNGSTTMRMGKNATSTVTMADDKQGGIGTVTFDAAKWGSDPDVTLNVEYSTDGGFSWISAGTVTITSSTATPFSLKVNKAGSGRIRLRQSAGSRWHIDNIGISNYSAMGAVNELDYHRWDAFSRQGRLVIEIRETPAHAAVYGMDGISWASGTYSQGEHEIELPKGLYIVVVDDFARRVVVK